MSPLLGALNAQVRKGQQKDRENHCFRDFCAVNPVLTVCEPKTQAVGPTDLFQHPVSQDVHFESVGWPKSHDFNKSW